MKDSAMPYNQTLIENAFEDRHTLSPQHCPNDLRFAVMAIIKALDEGKLRVAEPSSPSWIVHEWIKKAVLLYFRIQDNTMMNHGEGAAYDKVPLKFSHYDEQQWQKSLIRAVPGTIVRYGAYIATNTILMPSFVNIGAYVGDSTLVDTWATVGSCAQIGKHVHLSGGVGIGGVLEPLQAQPTIIEDHCFIGARSEVVEGVRIGTGAVLSMGVYIGQSTPIYDRLTGEISYGVVPPYSVVIPGNLPAKDGSHSLYAAIIVKKVDAQTRAKTSLNELLRPVMIN
jgi:2,3,4,5-tetrahydropyridine-2,6-dicarboxylate N-succinyltransferase